MTKQEKIAFLLEHSDSGTFVDDLEMLSEQEIDELFDAMSTDD